MNVGDVMTRDVLTARPDTPVVTAARLMVDHAISGLPVVDETGRVVGLVSEGDLILRQKPRLPRPWWRAFFSDPEALAREYQKVAGATVGEVMTRSVISVATSLPIGSAALVLDRHRIRRLPVIERGRLVGIVSRGDLIKAIAMGSPAPAGPRPDDQLVRDMRERMEQETWVPKHAVVVHADQGRMVLWGMVDTAVEKSALETMARAVPGVREIESHLVVAGPAPYHYGY